MATVMRYHGENKNAFADLAMQVAASSDSETTQFLPEPLDNAEFDVDRDDVPQSVTLYFDSDKNGACWYIVLTMEDFERIKELLSLTNK